MRAVHPLRAMTAEEARALQRAAKATSERADVVQRARALLAVSAGQSYTQAAEQAGYKSGDSVSQLVARFNQRGLAALHIARGRGRKARYTLAQRERIVAELQREPQRTHDGTATWSLKTLERVLRQQGGLPQLSATTIRTVLQEAGYRFSKSRTWCATGTALRVRHGETVTVQDPKAQGKKQLIECAYEAAEAAGLAVCCQDEAGPYQAIPHPGENWHLDGHPAQQPHQYVRGGTAKLLTLFRPATGTVRAQGVRAAPNAVLHPWLKGQLLQVLSELEHEPLPVRVPLLESHVLRRTWEHWWWSYERPKPTPPLRMLLIWDNLAGHRSYDLVRWLLQHGILPLYTPLSGSWLNMAESLQRILVRRALGGQHPESAAQLIDWLDQTVVGWNRHPTPFVWNGPRRRRRERAHLRRIGGSGAAVHDGDSLAT